jgi:hypothetical protein
MQISRLDRSSGDPRGGMRKSSGLSVALAIGVLILLSSGRGAWAQPHPPLQYHGGPVLQNFEIYPLYYGKWSEAQSEITRGWHLSVSLVLGGKP